MLEFKEVYLNQYYTLIGPLERRELKNANGSINDYYYGESTVEKCEIKMQNTVLNELTKEKKPDLVVGGELSNQVATTNMAMKERGIPFFGLYSACSTSVEGLIILANFISSKAIKDGVMITSSHNLNAEKQFRFPIEYGSPKPIRSTFTATAAVGMWVSNQPSKVKIINGTIGNVIDSGTKDVHNVGAVMAPSAVDTLVKHLSNTKTTLKDYDLILTGDLGKVGVSIFKELLQKEYALKITNHLDAGSMLYKNIEYSGASGPAALPLILLTGILPIKKYRKILLLATGALYSQLLVNQKNTLISVTHALTLEVLP